MQSWLSCGFLVAVASLVSGQDQFGGMVWDCHTMKPASLQDNSSFSSLIYQNPFSGPPMTFQISHPEGQLNVKPSESLTVEFKQSGQDTITSFAFKVHFFDAPDTALGEWTPGEDGLSVATQCGDIVGSSTILQQAEGSSDKTDVIASWKAPDTLICRRPMELRAAMSDGQGNWWLFTGTMIFPNLQTCTEGPGVIERPAGIDDTLPKVDLANDPHNLFKEAELAAREAQKRQEEINDEDKYSEGNWQLQEQKEEEEHQKEIQWEQDEYERKVQQEEQAREARIRDEIMDKEQHDREEHEQEEHDREPNRTPKEDEVPEETDPNVIDSPDNTGKTSGSVRAMCSLGVLLTTVSVVLL